MAQCRPAPAQNAIRDTFWRLIRESYSAFDILGIFTGSMIKPLFLIWWILMEKLFLYYPGLALLCWRVDERIKREILFMGTCRV
jgi:hypothetical protein